MHQHIFKVGWLLSHDSQTTVIFYYTAFLPGILLHELVYWLAAGIVNVRATRSIQLPKNDEIRELQLGFVKLARQVGPVKRTFIEFAPLLSALTGLWLIATDLLQLESVLGLASAGGLDNFAEAVGALTTKADFWLWFYLVFTVANTMVPSWPKDLHKRRLPYLFAALIAVGFVLLGQANLIQPEVTNTFQRLLSSLSLILLLVTAINLVMVLALGILESIIERLTGHSATFVDGKLVTMTRQEARNLQEKRKQQIPKRRPPAVQAKPETPIRSIYALPLPIPGPPGEEPISKSVVAVLEMPPPPGRPQADARSVITRAGGGDPTIIEASPAASHREGPRRAKSHMETPAPQPVQPKPAEPKLETVAPESEDRVMSLEAASSAFDIEAFDPAAIDAKAPFSRPFTQDENVDEEDYGVDSTDVDMGFARPFALPEGSDSKHDLPEPDFELKMGQQTTSKDDVIEPATTDHDESSAISPARQAARTKPVPKPSQLTSGNPAEESSPEGDGELRYEPIEDIDIYDEDTFDEDV